MTTRRTPTLVLGLLALAGGVSGQAVEPGDDGGPLVVGKSRESWKGFKLERLDAALEFRYEYRNDRLSQTGQPKQTNREDRYRETLDLSGEAIIGHKNLVDITGSIELGLEDIYTKNSLDGTNEHEQDILGFYDIDALILGTSLLPTNVYARRQQSQLNRAFAGSIDETLTEAGVTTRLQSLVAPTSVGYFHREDELSGDFGRIDSRTIQDSLSLQNGLVIGPRQRLDTTVNLDRIDERQGDTFHDSYERHDVNTVHTLAFGEEGRPHDLRSSIEYYDQGGLNSQEQIRWDELLTMRHTDRLETRYSTLFQDRSVGESDQRQMRGEASIKHRLFESLVSTAGVGVQRLETTGNFTSDEYFVNGQLDYTKKVPHGRIDAALGGSYNMQQNSDRGSTVRIVDETYTYTDGFPIIIARRNIVPSSVVVTPLAGFPVYQEGLDYRLDVFPDHAEIRGIVGGAFVNGQQIRVSYDIGPEPGNDIDTRTLNFSIRYSVLDGWLKGAAIYSTYRAVRQDISAVDPSLFALDNLDDVLVGLEYRRGDFEGRYEYNLHDSTFDGYTLHRLQGFYHLTTGTHSGLNAEWTHEIIDFTDQNDSVVFDRGSLKWFTRLGRELDMNIGLEYRREDSSLNGTSEGFDQTLGFTWTRRQTSIYASFRNSFLEGPGSDQTSQFLQFGIRRTF